MISLAMKQSAFLALLLFSTVLFSSADEQPGRLRGASDLNLAGVASGDVDSKLQEHSGFHADVGEKGRMHRHLNVNREFPSPVDTATARVHPSGKSGAHRKGSKHERRMSRHVPSGNRGEVELRAPRSEGNGETRSYYTVYEDVWWYYDDYSGWYYYDDYSGYWYYYGW
jgi:hypothetical protein